MKSKIFIILLLVVTYSSAQELKCKHAIFGDGSHAEWEPLYKKEVHSKTLVSSLSKKTWTYNAHYTPDSLLQISRVNSNNGITEPLFNFNKRMTTDHSSIEPARIVDVFDTEISMAILLAVPTGYLYVKITNNPDSNNKNIFFTPRAGVGEGPWKVIKCTATSTTFGIDLPELSPGVPMSSLKLDPSIPIESLKLSSLDKVMLKLKNSSEISVVDFSGMKILRDGKPINNSAGTSSLIEPSFVNIEAFENMLDYANRDNNIRLHLIKNYRTWVNGTEGGKAAFEKEIQRKLAGKPILDKIKKFDVEVFGED